eukprot:SAG31_NODE_42128_length_273_cov_0.586207_1_plen_39_part_01
MSLVNFQAFLALQVLPPFGQGWKRLQPDWIFRWLDAWKR